MDCPSLRCIPKDDVGLEAIQSHNKKVVDDHALGRRFEVNPEFTPFTSDILRAQFPKGFQTSPTLEAY